MNGVDIDEYETFLYLHETQLKSLRVPPIKWKTLFIKLQNSVFDAGENFMYATEEEIEYGAQNDLKVFTKCAMDIEDENHIYLIDHACVFSSGNCKSMLSENPALVERMSSMMEIPFDCRPVHAIINDINDKIWKYNDSYVLKNVNQDGSDVRFWFVMDEFGSRIHRSENPTFSVVNFFQMSENQMYSLLFPIGSVDESVEVTCAYPRFRSDLEDDMRKVIKLPWEPTDLSHLDYTQSEPNIEYFRSGRCIEIIPDQEYKLPRLINKKKILYYTEYSEVTEHLRNPRFVVTDDKNKAHILWLSNRFYDFKELADIKGKLFYLSQFPSEQVLINKELLSIVCRRAGEETSFYDQGLVDFNPIWLPTTYSLMVELPQFVSHFQNREKRGLDNVWICKPFNMARGIDIYITKNLDQIIRLSEMRPMVACKYLTDPVLFPKENIGLVKMDLRFIVLLKSVQDFELFVYERFWLRFANKPFSLDDFEDYEKHFTVMNYSEYDFQQMFCQDFIKKFEDYYPDYKWADVEESIHKMIKEVFIAATMKESPLGIGSFPGSRAMYGLDIMLQWDRKYDKPRINPVLIEVNFMPDCKRACSYYPEFYDDIFSVLFLDEDKGKHVIQL